MHISRPNLTRSKAFIAIALLIMSTLLPLFAAPNARAAVSIDSIDDSVTQWLYYRGVWACIGNFGEESNDDYTLSKNDVLDGKWFHDDKKGFGYLGPGLDNAVDNDGIVSCKDGSPIDRATEDYFGFNDEVDMLCALDDAMDDRGAEDAIKPSIGDGDCETSDSFEIKSSQDHGDGNWRASFTDILDASLASSGGRPRFDLADNTNSQAWYYWIGKRGLEVFCGDNTPISSGVDSDAGSSKDIVDVSVVNSTTGDITEGVNYYLANADRDQDSEVADVYYAQGSTSDAADRTCLELAALTKDNADAYSAYVIANPGEDLEDDGTGGSTDDSGSGPVCSAGTLGWVICPLIEVMQTITEGVANLLDGLLRLNPLDERTGGGGIYKIWQSVLNIANIVLVVGFLAVIFSQATSYGLSNYGAKRMLPRIIAAAILMNISFFICQVLVDVSNILGAGVAQLVQTVGGASSFSESVTEQTSGLQTAVTSGIAIAILVFFLLGPVVLGFLAVFLTVAARYAIIVLLVLVAPLAFAAWVLPNTEQYFKKWWKLFINMLLLYPMVMFVFAAAIIASQAVAAQAQEVSGLQGSVMQIMALVVMALPLFSMPLLFKAAGGVLGKIDDMTKRGARSGYDRGKKRYEKTGLGREAAMRKQSRENAAQRRYLEGKGAGGRLASGRRRLSNAGTYGALRTLRPTTAAGNMMMTDQIDSARRKIEDERIDSVHRNMSGNVATALSEGIGVSQLRSAKYKDASGKQYDRFSSAEDLATLDYLEKSKLTSKPDAALATAAARKLFDIENIPGHETTYDINGDKTVPISPDTAIQNLASMVGSDVSANKRFGEEVSSSASKHNYKNLAYGNVTKGKFTNYTEAGKTPLSLVQGGLTGVNKDMLKDATIASAIEGKVKFADATYNETTRMTTGTKPKTADQQRAARLEIIQQTMHITKDESIRILSGQLGMTPDMVKAVRQSISSNGTVPMPPGF